MPLEDRDASRLRDMLLWSRKAIFILGAATYEAMMANEEKRLALVRCLEVIGEAAHEVSPSVKAMLSSIPWPAMYGMRNRLIHDYGNTHYPIVFDVVHNELPGLASTVADFLAQEGRPL
jgi:uncharacterized protein with HEPN domain